MKTANTGFKDKITKCEIQLQRASLKLETQQLTFMKQKNKYEEEILNLKKEIAESKKPHSFIEVDLNRSNRPDR